MKFSCNVTSLLSGLTPVIEVSTKGGNKNFEGLNKINLDVTEEEIVISAFNGNVAIKTSVSDLLVDDLKYKCLEVGQATINAKDLLNVLGSFIENEGIVVEIKEEAGGKELVVTKESDPDEFQTLPLVASKVELPVKSEKLNRNVVIDRSLFVYSVNKIFFAIGFEETVQKYMHWAFRPSMNKARFVAGTGARFAIVDMEGEFIKVNGDLETMLFPKEHTLSVMKVLGSIKDEKLIIKTTNAKSTAPQIVIEAGKMEITFVELNPEIVYPDENKLLSLDYNQKFVTKLADWKFVGKGITATFNEDIKKEHRPHNATVTIPKDKSAILVKTSDVMKASRKVAIADNNSNAENDLTFICSSPYLKELADFGDDGYIQMEITSDSKKPVVIRYFAADKVQNADLLKSVNETTKVSETFTIFFATLQG